MKRFFAFYGDVYYPKGGMNDLVGDFHTKEEAISIVEEKHAKREDSKESKWYSDWANVWDSKTKSNIYIK
jgi:hypothetical protein